MHTTEKQDTFTAQELEAACIVQNPYDGKFYDFRQVFECLTDHHSVIPTFLAEAQIYFNCMSDEDLGFEHPNERGNMMSTFKWLWQTFDEMRPMDAATAKKKRLQLLNMHRPILDRGDE